MYRVKLGASPPAGAFCFSGAFSRPQRPEFMRRPKGPSPGRNQRPAQALPAAASHPQTPYEREQTTKRRGEISELAFALAAARHGFGISRPYGDSERYDIILD